MTIFKTAYDTTATDGFRMDKTIAAVERASIGSELSYVPNVHVRSVQGGSAVSGDIPQFEHPLLVEGVDKAQFVAFDARQFGKVDRQTGEYVVRNAIEYGTAELRAKLNYVWVTQPPNILRDISPIPASVFSAWIAESVSRRFTLDPEEQLRLSILAGYYYLCLFTAATHLDEHERTRMGAAVAKAVGASADDVFNVIGELPVIENISHFCSFAEQATGSVRLRELSGALLITLLGGTWFGHNHKEMVGVALEHPPTWLAILVACYQSRTFKNSQIAKIAESKNRQNAGENYVRSVMKMAADLIDQ